MTKVFRHDRGELRSPYRTPHGHLRAEGIATRAGVFHYRDAETGEIYGELRHPDDVFDPESLATLGGAPFTLFHPDEVVTPENFKDYGVGVVGDTVEVENPFVSVVLNIQRADGIEAISNGVNQLSCGYFADVIPERGIYDGTPYQFRQKNIRYNHLAGVPQGRAGPVAKIKLDSIDNVAIQEEVSMSQPKTPEPLQGVLSLRIDENTTISLEPAQHQWIADRFKRDRDRIQTLETENNELKTKLDAQKESSSPPTEVKLDQRIVDAGFEDLDGVLTAIADTKKQADELQAKLDSRPSFSQEEFEAKVRDRIAFEKRVDALLPEGFNFAGSSEREIKIAAIAHNSRMDASDLSGKSEDYINARFDAVLENQEQEAKPRQDSTIPLRLASGKATAAAAQPKLDEAEQARAEMSAQRTRRKAG